MPLRQVTGMVTSLLALAGLDWPVPDYSTLCRRQKGLLVVISHCPGTGALHLLIDSTGIKAEGDGEWWGPGNTGHRSQGNGARFTLELTRKRWKSAPSR